MVSRKQFGPTKLAGEDDVDGVRKGDAKAMAKETGRSSNIVKQLRHGVVGVINVARGRVSKGAIAGKDQRLGEGGTK
jgi:hypothetical protein